MAVEAVEIVEVVVEATEWKISHNFQEQCIPKLIGQIILIIIYVIGMVIKVELAIFFCVLTNTTDGSIECNIS